MRILLDSHYLVWAMQAPHHISQDETDAIVNPRNQIFFSAASIVELNMKAMKGKLGLSKNFVRELLKNDFTSLPMNHYHADALRHLPAIHSDPFDRMLAAQAKHENMIFMTRDSFLKQYPITLFRS